MTWQGLLAVPGVLLLALVVADAVVTAVTAGAGGGPLTRSIARRVPRVLARLSGGDGTSRLLAACGPAVLVTTFVVWTALLWGGWTLVFCASDGAVLDARTSAPASIVGRVYFAGYVVFTLGVGDLVPGDGSWQVLTAVASLLGLALVTLAITYLVSLVSAAVSRRVLARQVTALGRSGAQLVLLHWDGSALDPGLDDRLQVLSQQVLQTTEQHLAYPVLHTFHASDPDAAAPRALAVLDDALLLLSAGVAPSARPSRAALQALRAALEHYASTVTATGRGPVPPPPPPPLEVLREAGVPVVDLHAWEAAQQAHEERRYKVAELVAADTWAWPQG